MIQPCKGTTVRGTPCNAGAHFGSDWCRWHDPNPEAKAKWLDESRRGGENRNKAVALEPLSTVVDLETLNLESAVGVRALLSAGMKHTAGLPWTTTTSNALTQLANAALGVIESSDHEERLARLEAAQGPTLHRDESGRVVRGAL